APSVADHAMLGRHDRARCGRRLRAPRHRRQHAAEAERHGSLSAHESSRGDHRRDSAISHVPPRRSAGADDLIVTDADASMTEVAAIDPVLDDAPCGFVAFTDDGTVRMANRTLATMLGVSPDALVGRHVESMLTVGSRIFYQTHLFPMLRLHGQANEIFLLLRAAKGEDVAALANAVRRQRDGIWINECVLLRLE